LPDERDDVHPAVKRIWLAYAPIFEPVHLTHYTRYPQDQPYAVPDTSLIADTTVDHLIFGVTQSIKMPSGRLANSRARLVLRKWSGVAGP
jgi:hypothetical protein